MAVESTLAPLGAQAPSFRLKDVTSGEEVSLDHYQGKKALLVIFLSAHCPFVVHIQSELAAIGQDYQNKDVGIVGISANDPLTYPDDAPEQLKEFARKQNFTFPILFDETQEVAKAYQAACTPDFFVYDLDFRLAYRGQLDDSRPKNDVPVTGRDIRAALDALIDGNPVKSEQRASIGCSIKWTAGNEPGYFFQPNKEPVAV